VIERSIGIFDSGIGGLTVLREIIKVLPFENTIYLGDTARVPYGTKSAQTIKRYALEDAQFLISQGIKLLVIACNTASAICTSFLRENLNLPTVEVIGPGAKKAVASTTLGKVGVIGTEATIKSGAYSSQIRNINPDIEVFSKACPLFVPLVEETWNGGEDESFLRELKTLTVKRYLKKLKEKGIDTLVLGCTHYPLLKEPIDTFMGEQVKMIDSAEEIAEEVLKVMREEGLCNRSDNKGHHKYFVSDAPDRFIELGMRFLGTELEEVTQIEVTAF